MLDCEKVRPERLGYDRPSEKLLGFLAKHYSLKRYMPQNNNYVVYNAYFEGAFARPPSGKPEPALPSRQVPMKSSE